MYSEITDYCRVNDYIESLFVKIINNDMVLYIVVILYSNSLLPMILKPTRDTETITTLMDIFTNKYNINDNILQGIFATDISDHYTIFHIHDKCAPYIEEYQLIRLMSPEC